MSRVLVAENHLPLRSGEPQVGHCYIVIVCGQRRCFQVLRRQIAYKFLARDLGSKRLRSFGSKRFLEEVDPQLAEELYGAKALFATR